ncbi:MAG: hypothetical protein KDD12_24405, partial [Lewinella sp.]|nr:hypothetical protein [Lewinella sp.]
MHMIHPSRLFLFAMFGCLILSCHQVKGPDELQALTDHAAFIKDLYAGLPFDMPRVKEPRFPDFRVNITEFGAVGDGMVKNTQAIAAAIAAVAEKGGGTVVIPRGIWLTGP